MKLTKFGHSCVLVEVEDGKTSVALFDPGVWSSFLVETAAQIDYVFISHIHPDHMDIAVLKSIVLKFPKVRITAPTEVVEALRVAGVTGVSDVAPEGAVLFTSPHEGKPPYMQPPEEIGIHFLDVYSHPGDSHSFGETKDVLALPVQAPWGSTMNAALLAIDLKPRYILPVHDWHWRDEARVNMYDRLETFFRPYGITFLKPVDGETIEIDVQ